MEKSCRLPLTFLVIALFTFNTPKLSAQSSTIETTGDVILFALPASTIATTLIIGDGQGTWQFAKGALLSQALTFGLKVGVNKQRPDMSNDNSFPSGHTSTTFQSAAFIHKRYGFKYSIPAYALAGFTAFSRLNADKHDGFDILAGAVIGIGSSYLFTTEYQRKHMELTFGSDNGSYALGFVYRF